MNNFFEEMKQRKVFRTITAYAVVAFIIMQLVEIVFPIFDIPNWAGRMVIILLFLGLPVAIILSWIFDITKGGIKKGETQLITQEPSVIGGLNLQIDKRLFFKNKRFWFAGAGIMVGLALGLISTKGYGITYFLKSSEKSLAVVSFQNLSEDEDNSRIGQILQELIITDLSDIPLLKVFSSQRLFDVQKQLGFKSNRFIDPALALDVAKGVGASSMLTGNIIDTGLKKVLTSRLLRVDDGSVVKTHSVEGENIYALVDLLTVLVKADLKISEKVPDLDIKEKTTESITAFKFYLEGMEMLNDNRYENAIVKLEDALDIDSTFNDALYALAITEWWINSRLGDEGNSVKDPNIFLRRILKGKKVISPEYREKVEATELLIDHKWDQALVTFEKLVVKYPQEKDLWYNLGECYFHSEDSNIRALDAFERTLKLDPEYTLAYTHIFDIYYREKMFDHSIKLAKVFISQHPDSPRGYLALGQALIADGNINEAKINIHLAKKLDPDDFTIDLDLVILARLEEDYAAALNIIESLLNKTTNIQNSNLLEILTNIRIEQGQFARSILTREMILEQVDENKISIKNGIYIDMAASAFNMNDTESYKDYMSKVDQENLSIENFLNYKITQGFFYYRQNNVNELVKISNAVMLKINSTGYSGGRQYISDFLLGLIHIQKQELDEAEIILTGRIKNAPVWQDMVTIFLAEIYLKKENPEKALEMSRKMLSPTVDNSVYQIIHPLGYYMKGIALENMERYNEAIEVYTHLLKIWEHADAEIPELIDTKNRLSRLIEQS